MRQKILVGVGALLIAAAAFNAYQRFGPAAERAAVSADKVDRAARRVADDQADAAAAMSDAFLVGELARQSIRVAAERGGVALADSTFASRASAEASPLDVRVAAGGAGAIRFTIDGVAKPIAFEMAVTPGPGDLIPYEAIVAALAPHLSAELADAIVAAGGRAPGALGDAAVPDGVEAMLLQPDPFAAFRAARLVHVAVAADGMSPARLGALARAYATFGDGTRLLLGGHADVAFARALIYAEQLVAARPNDPASYWTRAYVRAAVALPGAAADVAKARSLGGDAPKWATLTAAAIDGDTAALFRAADAGPEAALAAHLALRTVELSRLDAVVIRLAELALARDPADVRAMLVAIDNAGVSKLHDFTTRFPTLLNRASDAAGSWPELPRQGVAPAFAAARRARYDADARLALWRALDAAPADAGPLRWGTLADVARETSFALAQRRLDFVKNKWAVDVAGDFDAWWPVVEDHPAAPALAIYAGRGDGAALAAMPASVTSREQFVPLAYLVRDAGLAGAVDYNGWFARINARVDQTIDTIGREAWAYFYQRQGDTFSRPAGRFYAAAPDDPNAIAFMIAANWPAMRDREPALTELAANAPQVAWALAERAIYDREFAKAARHYEAAAAFAPTWSIYSGLARARRSQADVEGAVRAYEAFLADGQDVGLSSASARAQIAELLMLVGEPARALPYSEAAADSYAAWALFAYAENLARLGRNEASREVFRRTIDRYGSSHQYHVFIAGLVEPRVVDPAIDRATRAEIAEKVAAGDVEWRRAVPIVEAVDGDLDAAARSLVAVADALPARLDAALDLATVQLMRGDVPAARAAIDRLRSTTTGDNYAYAYTRAAAATEAILNGGAPPMPMAAGSPLWFDVDAFARATNAAVIGAACERMGHADAARAWYACATRCVCVAPGRVYAAIALRSLDQGR